MAALGRRLPPRPLDRLRRSRGIRAPTGTSGAARTSSRTASRWSPGRQRAASISPPRGCGGMADAPSSGGGELTLVEVRLLSSASESPASAGLFRGKAAAAPTGRPRRRLVRWVMLVAISATGADPPGSGRQPRSGRSAQPRRIMRPTAAISSSVRSFFFESGPPTTQWRAWSSSRPSATLSSAA